MAISLQMYTIREQTKTLTALEDSLRKLRKIGFDTVQYSVPDSFGETEVKKLFDRYSMKNDSVYCPFLSLEEKEEAMLRQCELFATKYVRVDSIPRDLVSPAGFRMFARYLNEAADGYAKEGIKIVYHFHSFEFINFGDTTGIDILVSETDPEKICFQPDTFWIQSGGRDPATYIEKIRDRVNYIHVKDYAIGRRSEKLESTPARFAVIGEGNLDFARIMEVCRGFGCPYYVIEQDECYGENPFDCVKRSFDNLVKLGAND